MNLHFPDTLQLVYDMVNVYSRLLDEDKPDQAKTFLIKITKELEKKGPKPHLQKLLDHYIQITRRYSLEPLDIIPPKKRLEEFEQAIIPHLSRVPKQYLDSKFRGISETDLSRPVNTIADTIFKPEGIKREDIEVAIQGGIQGISWTFEQNKIVHSIFYLFNKASYPQQIKAKQSEIFEAIGMKGRIDSDGKKRYHGGPKGIYRTRFNKNLEAISNKSVPFVYSAITGKDKKGKPLRTLAIDKAPIIKIIPVYRNVENKEYQGILSGNDTTIHERFSHYLIQLNPNITGDVKKYFRMIPATLSEEISEFRSKRGERSSAAELDFIEYLYLENKEIIEINYLELAKKLKIKALHDKKWVRQTTGRCYETGIELGFVSHVEINKMGYTQPKDVIYINPERFYKPKRNQKKLPT